jgi:hypothetical protein
VLTLFFLFFYNLSDGSRLNNLMVFEISTTTIELIDMAADDIVGFIVTPNE